MSVLMFSISMAETGLVQVMSKHWWILANSCCEEMLQCCVQISTLVTSY